jgi:hypothetical protein
VFYYYYSWISQWVSFHADLVPRYYSLPSISTNPYYMIRRPCCWSSTAANVTQLDCYYFISVGSTCSSEMGTLVAARVCVIHRWRPWFHLDLPVFRPKRWLRVYDNLRWTVWWCSRFVVVLGLMLWCRSFTDLH